jgi:hypothetical protein
MRFGQVAPPLTFKGSRVLHGEVNFEVLGIGPFRAGTPKIAASGPSLAPKLEWMFLTRTLDGLLCDREPRRNLFVVIPGSN